MKVTFRLIDPKRLTFILLSFIAVLIVLSSIRQAIVHLTGHGRLFGFVHMFYVDQEANVPTWYSSIALLLASVILFTISTVSKKQQREFVKYWYGLSAIFFMMSMDEVALFHDRLVVPMREVFPQGGALYYAWVVPGMLFVMAVGLIYFRFLFKLPARTRNLFIVAAFVFVGGAIGIEMLSGIWANVHGEANPIYAAIVTFEEGFEMVGIVVFIHALMEYLQSMVSEVKIQLG